MEQQHPLTEPEITRSSDLEAQSSSALPLQSAEPETTNTTKTQAPKTYPQIQDVDGILWDIRDKRPTKHGFNVFFGYPAKPLLRKKSAVGKFRLIVTPELVTYWEAHYTDDAAIYDLPASRKTIDKVQRRVCFKLAILRRSTRRRRTPPPSPPSIREFARRYEVSMEDAQEWHMFLLDPTPRPHQWWRDPAPLAVLLSDVSVNEMCRALGISEAYAFRLRKLALALRERKLTNPFRKPQGFSS